MDDVKSFRDLIAWKKAIELSRKIYNVTRFFPKEEIFGMTSQMKRAVVSIASNIAEGQGRNSTGEFLQFLGISKGSLYELETQLIISQEIGFITKETSDNLLSDCEEINRLLRGLMYSLRK